MTIAVLFPGQGSQFVGMGEELFDLRPDLLGPSADEILGWSLREMCLTGPESELTLTEHAQPALFALSYALWTEAEKQGLSPASAAGHSLGEYTALTAGGVLDFPEALSLVARRGLAMAHAARIEPSGMAALLGADVELAERVVAANSDQGGRLQVANLNAPGQVVVAGSKDDIEWLESNGRDLGVRRAVPLKVAGAFHSSFMGPASAELEAALDAVTFHQPTYDIWSNTTARPHQLSEVPAMLAAQAVSPVLFQQSLEGMATSGADVFVHVGPGDVTAGMAKRSLTDVEVHVISSIGDIPRVIEAVGTMS